MRAPFQPFLPGSPHQSLCFQLSVFANEDSRKRFQPRHRSRTRRLVRVVRLSLVAANGARVGIAHGWLIAVLLLTLMLGPAGLLLYFALRFAMAPGVGMIAI